MEKNQLDNTKKIAKNTILLYIRMLITTFVSLFTARLTLQLLGVADYGINNLISGIIGFMGIVTGTMTSATQRFLAYDLGQHNVAKYRCSYSMLLNIFVIFSLISVVVLEIVGPYLIKNYLVIPENRIEASLWLFHFTVVNFILVTINIPQTASIISYEKMGIYAYFTFLDVFFKLLVVYALYITQFDKLITLGFLSTLMSLCVNGITYFYCVKKLEGCKYTLIWDFKLFRKIFSYSGWNLFGSVTGVMNQQGQAVLLNLFFGPVVNAAKAVADKINQIISSFSTNFFMAVTPQIIKSYSSHNIDYMRKLVLASSRYSFFLLFCLSVPLIANMKTILCLWLGSEQVSFDMIRFCQLLLVYSLVNVLELPVTQTVRATGNIRNYQIRTGGLTLLFIPICYIIFSLGMPAYYSMVVLSCLYAFVQIIRVKMIEDILSITIFGYFKIVIVPILKVVLLSCCMSILTTKIFDAESIFYLFVNVSLEVMFCLISVLFLGINSEERNLALNYFKNKLKTNVFKKES